MGLENSFKNQKKETEKPFSEEGLLNRNFGKDVEKPSEALFYRDGILNRPKFQEMIHGQREKEDAEKLQQIREELGIVEGKPVESGERPFSPKGLLNRNFGGNKEQAPTENEDISSQESGQDNLTNQSDKIENLESIAEKPLIQQMVEAYMKLSDDPEKSAREALYNRFDPSLSEEEKQKQMTKMVKEYQLYKEGKDWKQN